MRPFAVVKDRGFISLMKTGRPYDSWIPSPTKIADDLMVVWHAVRLRVMQMLEVSNQRRISFKSRTHLPQDYDCEINISTDAWTSPNHLAFVAFIAQLEREGKPLSFLLDILEVPESHTGEALAREFNGVLQDFGVDDKVCVEV